MSRVSDLLAPTLVALSLSFTLAAPAARAGTAAGPVCGDGVCTLNVDAAQSIEPCANAPITLVWRTEGGATLIQCETADAEMERPSLLLDRRRPAGPAYTLQGVRYFSAASVAEAAKAPVPDAFSAHALCRPATSGRATPGDFFLLRKVPSDNAKDPYCYRATRVSTAAGAIALQGNDPDMPKPDLDHHDWDPLAARMLALIPASGSTAAAPAAAPVGADSARVVHAKAALRDQPDLAATAHGYLVQGDSVTVLDRGHAGDGWVKVRYAGKSGPPIDRWIRADDLGLSQPAAAVH